MGTLLPGGQLFVGGVLPTLADGAPLNDAAYFY
jgi:hypothetical protein